MHKFFIPLASACVLTLATLPFSRAADQTPVPALIPQPKQVEVQPGMTMLTPASQIVVGDDSLMPLAKVLASEIQRTTGLDLKTATGTSKAGDILLDLDDSLKGEAYRMEVGDRATISAGNYDAVASGTVTLLQAITQTDGMIHIPRLTVTDEPSYPFRSVLLDLARKYHSPDGIKQVIELARLYKIRYVHLNLSDDQLFMFPSTAFPNVGKGNGEFARFEPASKPHIEPYTLDELKDLEKFAVERGVHLIPELNMPGHAGRLVGDAPETFAFPGNGSTINIASPKVLAAAETLLNEVMDVFQSSPYVHLGADEVSMGGLEETPEFAQVKKDDPKIKNAHDLFGKFVQHLDNIVKKRGKKAIVWEEGWSPEGPYPLPKDVVVMVWSQGRNPNAIAGDGYQITNATWTPLYIVRNDKRPLDFLYNWKLTQFGREGSNDYTPLEPTLSNKLLGAQLCSWEDSEAIEIQSLRGRLAIVAEKSWNKEAKDTFEQFQTRLASTDAILESLVNPITIAIDGKLIKDESTYAEPMNITLTAKEPGFKIRYTLDNTLPNPNWKDYTGPIHIDDPVYLRAGLFDDQGKQHGHLVGSWYRRINVIKPNLATGKPVTVGPAPDRNDSWSASVAVDGKADDVNSHWASSGPAPQWLQVDLGKVEPIDYINVITYWDGSRYYQFTAEASVDGKTWKKVADYSTNTIAATASGYPTKFEKTDARYVRINMLKNSANPDVHIVELIVNKAK